MREIAVQVILGSLIWFEIIKDNNVLDYDEEETSIEAKI